MVSKNKKHRPELKEDVFVSVVMVAADEQRGLRRRIKQLVKELDDNYQNYEVVVVDNGTAGDTVSDVVSLLDSTPCIRIMQLSRPANYDTALLSGVEAAIGDFVCTLNPVMDPIEKIVEMVSANQSTSVIQGVSSVPVQGLFGTRLGRRLFYWYNRRYIGVTIPINATYFASYARHAVNALMASRRSHRHIRHLVRVTGFRPREFEYMPLVNPVSQRTMRTGVIEALEIASSYSTHPLRFATWLGFFAGIINILYAVYIVIVNFTKSDVIEGWTTTSLQFSGMFFILFAILVILAEYIGRILTESRHEPEYYIVDEQSSTVSIANQLRRNIEK